ncbi:MAG: adenylate/guanylate cyclase domain-containing protein [Candidatus Cybelea sp.]
MLLPYYETAPERRLASRRLPRGTVTFVFTDIEGSSTLWERFPDSMRRAIELHDSLIKKTVRVNRGAIFKTLGDGVACAFEDPADALAATVEVQRALKSTAWPADIDEIRVRIGIHTGTAVKREADYFGPTLNRAARLMSIGHGGQILVSSATAALLRDVLPSEISLRELGSYRLKDLSLSETTYQVVGPELRAEFPALTSVDSHPNNLPSRISTFVGREEELEELRSRVSDRAIITIVGMGGIGKTRLALQLASDVIDRFPGGAWFVDLSGLHDGSLVATAVAEALGVREVRTEPLLTTITSRLSQKPALLVVDNAEHLLNGVRGVLREVITHSRSTRILVTSREPLHLDGEYVFRLGPIANAGRLFTERASTISSTPLPLDGDELVARLCSKLGNVPLAIELAAARTSMLSIEQLDQRLGAGFEILSSRTSEVERHRTLEATIDWSYELLEEPEKELFESLSIFTDGFTIDACEVVTACSTPNALLDLLQSLIEKSLVNVFPAELGLRYRLVDAVHEFALKRRLSRDSPDSLSQKHVEYFTKLVASYALSGGADSRRVWIKSVNAEIGNCRSAIEWSLETKSDAAGEMLQAFAFYCQSSGKLGEGRTWLRRYLEAFDGPEARYPRLLQYASFFAALQDDYGEAMELATRLKANARSVKDPSMEGEALHALAAIEQRRGNPAQARAHYDAALKIFESVGGDRECLVSVLNLVNVLLEEGSLERCRALLKRADQLAAKLEDDELTALTLSLRGSLALYRGKLLDAEQQTRAALALQSSSESGRRMEHLSLLAEVLARQGRHEEAQAIVNEVLMLAIRTESHGNIIRSFEILAFSYFGSKADAEALKYYAAAHQMRRTYGFHSQNLFQSASFESALRNRTGGKFGRALRESRSESWQALLPDPRARS